MHREGWTNATPLGVVLQPVLELIHQHSITSIQMASARLFEAFIRRCAEHGIEVKITDDPQDTFIIIIMRMLDYIENARAGILIPKATTTLPDIKIVKR